jgi:hypothetical protein
MFLEIHAGSGEEGDCAERKSGIPVGSRHPALACLKEAKVKRARPEP